MKYLSALFVAAVANAQMAPLHEMEHPYSLSSGPLTQESAGVLFEKHVSEPGVEWMRVVFDMDETVLAPHTQLKLVSAHDGYEQVFKNAEALKQWNGASAYFNGDRVTLKVISAPSSSTRESARNAIPKVAVKSLIVPPPVSRDIAEGPLETICGENDDRVLSIVRRDGRILPMGCTGWIFNDEANCLLTAGHCNIKMDRAVVQFHVPLNYPNGTLQHPKPKHQYPVDPASIQVTEKVSPGNDWMYFGVFANEKTQKTVFQTERSQYKLFKKQNLTESKLKNIQISGYGVSSNKTVSQVQQINSGNFTNIQRIDDKLMILRYEVDTTGGNSGSAIFDLDSRKAIGIHTNGGCGKTGGANFGTPITHPDIQAAIKNPKGVCKLH